MRRRRVRGRSPLVLTKRVGEFIPPTPLGERLAVNRAEVEAVLARFGALNSAVFASVARGDDGDGSDVDLLVDLPDDVTLFGLSELESALADLLGGVSTWCRVGWCATGCSL